MIISSLKSAGSIVSTLDTMLPSSSSSGYSYFLITLEDGRLPSTDSINDGLIVFVGLTSAA